MNNHRYLWVDSLKFLGIFAIYIGHFGQGAGQFYSFVFNYHVPLFFFAAGFFASYKKDSNIMIFFISKFKRLMLPYFAFAFIVMFINAIISHDKTITLFQACIYILKGIRNDPYVGSIWFFNCLFVTFIIDYIFYKIIKNKYFVLLLSIVSLYITQYILKNNPYISPSWFWNIDSALAYWWLLAFGRCLFNQISHGILFKRTLFGYSLFLITFILSLYQLLDSRPLFITILDEFSIPYDGNKVFSILNIMITTLSLVIFNTYIAKYICKFNIINHMGKNTLNICGLEYITKVFLSSAISITGLSLTVDTPVSAVIYTALCVYVANKIGYWLNNNFHGVFSVK
ncbi:MULTISPECIES: acyltransferase family protein [Proteus]|nr:acyltransferase family protein [Proteus columbae]